ncbi:MAG: tetratricopeptide repeat protein [Hyphomicrobium sp.]
MSIGPMRLGYGRTAAKGLAIVSLCSLTLGGCAGVGDGIAPSLFASSTPPPSAADEPKAPQDELQKATEYWGKQYAEKPSDLDTALSYAKNLKALGQKQQALGVLQQASMFHATDRRLNSEYGRLALELDQVSVADKLLAAADDPTSPDWRVLSARGTVLAKQGRYQEAIPLYEKAQQLSADQPSVLNNLALAYAMSGEAARAEDVLRRVSANGGNAKVRQNLALVLGLQGKYDEATKVGSEVMNASNATSNTDILKRMVRLDAKPYAPAGGPDGPASTPASWTTTVAVASGSSVATPDWKTSVSAEKAKSAPPNPAAAAPTASAVPTGRVAEAGSPSLRATAP